MGRLANVRFLALTGAALLAAGALVPARAQDPDDLKRGVARISLMDGQVSVRRGDAGEWVAGIINAPLMAGDAIATAPNSRAEVQLDGDNLLRLGANAEVRLTTLEYGRYQMELARGTMTYRVLRATTANVEIDTPSVSVRPAQAGTFRISVSEAGETEVTARAGNVEVFTPRGSQWVNAGQTLMARGTASDPEFQIASAIPYDDWDRWNDSRDQTLVQAAASSAQYVPQGVAGAEDLGSYGTWDYVAPYGYCWRPTVAVGWAPYSYGRWVWLDWYGWTWVSYDPWGWAPYHYGRWFWEARFGWCWYPGMFGVRNYWSPALVAFFGFGGGGGFGFGFGHVGWVPLAPFETFHPWWGRGFYGRNFGNNINITNVNVTNIYRNARVRNGISSVNTADFHGGRFGSVSHVSAEQVGSAGLIRGQMPITPDNANLRFSDRQAFTPRTTANTRFFTHQQPASVERVPFAQQRGAEAAGRAAETPNRGGLSSGPAARETAPAQNAFRGQSAPQVRQGESPSNGGLWRHFGEPAGQRNNTPAPRNDNSGWRGSQSPTIQNSRPSESTAGRPAETAPRSEYRGNAAPRYEAPPVRERPSAPSYSAPQRAPSYSAPRPSAPSYSAPRSSGGGGGGHPSGGGARSSGGGHGGGGRR